MRGHPKRSAGLLLRLQRDASSAWLPDASKTKRVAHCGNIPLPAAYQTALEPRGGGDAGVLD